MKETTSKATSDEEDLTVYFKATGNEPFWGLKIGKDKTVFTSLIEGMESISFESVEPIRAMDANVKMYRLNNGKTSATVTIQQFDCQDSMSGEKSPYTVKVEINSKTLNGCGKYITDYRLHDIWVLEELNGKKVALTDFQKELPRIEIHAADNKFMGFGGCNSIGGTIFYEKDLLRFSNVISTLMACASGNKEGEFIKALQSTTTYTIGNNRLTLSNPSGKLLVLRKVD
ncbi:MULTISPECIES: META domain-containing protein [unclassified Flavobacterium]|uniref:META domain-containing protein n=1 Tax=unclassified Flavobacterium TaxID=196869 RepID=UPI001F363D6D|nr:MULTISPECIES: META domain-containing protein [unclassified Flavobacterium]